VFGQAPQVVQFGRRGVQGQRLLPHRQPGIVEEFGVRRLRVIGVGQVFRVRQVLGVREVGRVREILGLGEVGRVGEVEFIDLEPIDVELGVLEFGVLRPGTGLELGYPQPVAYPLTRNIRRALP